QVQVERSAQQGRAARRGSEQARALDALAGGMEQGETELRESAGSIWLEMSPPGAAPDPQQALQWARQAAGVSAPLGTAAERARAVCRQLVTLMNHIAAEGNMVTEFGRKMKNTPIRCVSRWREWRWRLASASSNGRMAWPVCR